MTRDGAIKHRDIILAYADGADIEYYDYGTWRDTPAPQFDPRTEYRIKPKEEIIPMDFSDAERLIGKTIRVRRNSDLLLITSCEHNNVVAGAYGYSYKDLLNYCEFLDGSPIGKLSK